MTEQKDFVNEKELEDVTGGATANRRNCFFVPEQPLHYETRSDGSVWVRCGSGCFICSCHGSLACVHRMHRMEARGGGSHFPLEFNRNNHSAPDKEVRLP